MHQASKQKNQKLTKAERKQLKLQENKEWLSNYRSNGIEQKDLNSRYSKYYQLQLASYWGSELEEWDNFIKTLKVPLPVTFRVSQRCPLPIQQLLLKWLATKAPQHQKIYLDDQIIEVKVENIPWSPFTRQLSFDNSQLLNQPLLQKLNTFLTKQCQLGWIVRQELVSMIPVLLLDVQYHQMIFDCCAAPGSKTEQILAAMEESYRNRDTSHERGYGCLAANDTDQKRIFQLLEKFHTFPFPSLLFTNMNGEQFTSYFESSFLESFDRILCDVPCSGDGTFRKSPHLWRLFRPRTAIQFHIIQRKILLQALQLLKVGGRLVYSTCSLNPIEDEAVVASVLQEFGEADDGEMKLRLVDVSSSPCVQSGLIYRKGLSFWHSDMETFLIEENDESERKETMKRIQELPLTMNPPANSDSLHLDHCLRILPHDQNTGGFFVAVFEKVSSFTTSKKGGIDKKKKGEKKENNTSSSSSSSIFETNNKKSLKSSTLKVMKEIGFNPKHKSSSLSEDQLAKTFEPIEELSPSLAEKISSLFPFKQSDQYRFIAKRAFVTEDEKNVENTDLELYIVNRRYSNILPSRRIITLTLTPLSLLRAYELHTNNLQIPIFSMGMKLLTIGNSHIDNLNHPVNSIASCLVIDHTSVNDSTADISQWRFNQSACQSYFDFFDFPNNSKIQMTDVLELQDFLTQRLLWKQQHPRITTKPKREKKEEKEEIKDNEEEKEDNIGFQFLVPIKDIIEENLNESYQFSTISSDDLRIRSSPAPDSPPKVGSLSLFDQWKQAQLKAARPTKPTAVSNQIAEGYEISFLFQDQLTQTLINLIRDKPSILRGEEKFETILFVEYEEKSQSIPENTNKESVENHEKSGTTTSSSLLGKRRLSKAERKKLAKQPKQSLNQSRTSTTDENEEDKDDEGEEKEGRKTETMSDNNNEDIAVTRLYFRVLVEVINTQEKKQSLRFISFPLSSSDYCESILSLI